MRVIFLEKRQETPTVYSFLFKPTIQFTAGQLIHLTVPHENPDSRGISRPFTISSSPTEDFLMVTTRIIDNGSSFKKALLNLPEGTTVEIDNPAGNFTREEEGSHHLFITGGVGITPVRSILKYVTDKKLNIPLTLLYSNVTAEEIAFHDFLNGERTHNSKLDIIYTVTQPEKSAMSWDGRVGRIDKALIQEKMKKNSVFYICGPTSLVDNFINLLQEMGIAEKRIKRENFPGY